MWFKAQSKAEERRKRTTLNSKKDPIIVWEALDLLKDKQWSPRQISGKLAKEGKHISHELIYQYVRADKTGELAANCRHKMKYNRHGRPAHTTKVKNIPNRTSIHDRPKEANGTRFGDWEMDTIIGKGGKGVILTLTERSTNLIFIKKLKNGKDPKALAKVVVQLLYPFKGTGVFTITTDNGSEFCAHETIAEKLKTKIYFADSYASWQKGAIKNANKLIRQYIPKGTDFNEVSDKFIKNIQVKINERPREKLDFSSPIVEFYKHYS